MIDGLALQALSAFAYYIFLIVTMRVSGKRLAGQTTSFDLIVLIAVAVVIQGATLQPGALNAAVFVFVVLAAHRLTSVLCSRFLSVRRLLRGTPRVLVRNGHAIDKAMREEGISHDELKAGLRKLGFDSEKGVVLATLEETGHISAVAAAADTTEQR